jgi:diacylglycerol O-acyltransferase / wax synthase
MLVHPRGVSAGGSVALTPDGGGPVMPLDRPTAEDIRILNLEAGNVRGHVCKLLVLEPAPGRPLPTLDDLRAHIEARLDAAPRLRRRLVRAPLNIGAPVWIDDAGFDIARHVRSVDETAPVGPARLREIVSGLMAQRLDRDHPLWRIDVVDPMSDGSMALVWRIHHCLADGTTAVRLAGDLLWSDASEEAPGPPSAWRPAAAPRALSLLAHGAASTLGPAARGAVRLGSEARSLAQARRAAQESKAALRRELARTAGQTPLDRRAGPERRVAFASAPLQECRRAAKAIDHAVTVNDVVLAAVAGGMRAWLGHRHLPEHGIRAKVPVSLHDHGAHDATLANRDSYFFVDLPVGEARMADRLRLVSRQTAERKRLHDADALYVAGRRRSVARRAMSPRVFTLNVSNVPGPADDVYVLGARVRELYSVAEIAEHHALRVAVISAAGTLFFGLCADRDAVDDAELIAEGIRASVRDLVAPVGAG